MLPFGAPLPDETAKWDCSQQPNPDCVPGQLTCAGVQPGDEYIEEQAEIAAAEQEIGKVVKVIGHKEEQPKKENMQRCALLPLHVTEVFWSQRPFFLTRASPCQVQIHEREPPSVAPQKRRHGHDVQVQ